MFLNLMEDNMFGFFNKNNGKVINVNDIDNLIGKIEKYTDANTFR